MLDASSAVDGIAQAIAQDQKKALPRLVAPEDRCRLHAFERVPGARRHIFDQSHFVGQPASGHFGDDMEERSQPAIADQRDGHSRTAPLRIRGCPDDRQAGFEFLYTAECQHGERHEPG